MMIVPDERLVIACVFVAAMSFISGFYCYNEFFIEKKKKEKSDLYAVGNVFMAITIVAITILLIFVNSKYYPPFTQ